MNKQRKLQIEKSSFVADIMMIVANARQKAYSAVNSAMVEAYWLIGKRIVEYEQSGQGRAAYGEEILKTLSVELTREFGKGFGTRNLWDFRKFYQTFGEYEIMHTLCAQLSWSHVRLIMRVENKDAQKYYFKEAAENHWSVRTLDRNISTLYYHRLLSSQIEESTKKEISKKHAEIPRDNMEFIKNPSVLEFLGLPDNSGYAETDLEQAIIDKMQKFLLEMGKGFAFVERQQHIRTETQDFYIDLVFYNYILKCFVIVELKTDKITHQDIGQLDMYVRMYDDLKRLKGDNPAIGILLCTETDKTIAKYSVLSENKQLFASKYLSYLPTEEELAAEIERQKVLLKLSDKPNAPDSL